MHTTSQCLVLRMCVDAVRMNDAGVTNHAVEQKIKSWLRQACDRSAGRKRRERRSEQLRVDSELPHMSTDYSDSNQSTDPADPDDTA